MPKYKEPKSSIFTLVLGFILIVLLIISAVYSVLSTPYLLLVIPVLAIYIYYENKRTKTKFSLLAEERKEISICEFARSFNTKKIDTWVVRAVYEQIQAYVPTIPIKENDTLFELLEIDEEDLEFDLLAEISQRTGRSLEGLENNKHFKKLKTVGDLVYMFNEQPLKNNVATNG